MKFTGIHPTDYEKELKEFIIKNESIQQRLYVDTKGVEVLTIGAGYAIGKRTGTDSDGNIIWQTDFKNAGIDLTQEQKDLLNTYIEAINKETTNAEKEALIEEYYTNPNAVTLTNDQAAALFVVVKEEYEDIVKNKLGSELYNSLIGTKELVALVDLAYNGGENMFGALATALKNNDRAEAWFQIRYYSNGGDSYKSSPTGIARRRVAESNTFGLYPTDANENYYKQVMRMYQNHKDIIYEKEHSNYTGGNTEPMRVAYEEDGLIDVQLSPAKEYLVSHYAKGTDIDGDIVVGNGIGSIPESYADGVGNDGDFYLQGSDKNDLIFGEKGNDDLYGRDGNDVLYGGEGIDTLYGGSGEDTLIGGYSQERTDAYADRLEGGSDYDTYYAGNGDTIYDSDGKGVVSFEGAVLSGGKWNEEKGVYEGDGGEYTLDNGVLIFQKNGQTLTITNYHKDAKDLKIVLSGKKDDDEHDDDKKGGDAGDFSSPLVLDLNNDAITSQDIYDTNTHFDMNLDGFKERTAWIQSEDGLLALDKNQDGIINDSSELFGDNTYLSNGTKASNGFEALKQYDRNDDGTIDKQDDIYDDLKVWIDKNQDGISQTDELKTLQELNISSIELNPQQTDTTQSRNNVSHTTTFTQNGEVKKIDDVWFEVDNQDTTYEATTITDPTIQQLPNLKGSGRVKNLRDAMSEDATLTSKVQSLLSDSATATYNELLTQTKDILIQWTHTDNIDPDKTRGEQYILNHDYGHEAVAYRYRVYAYAQDVAILENFSGRAYSDEILGTKSAQHIKEKLEFLQDKTLINLLAQNLYGESVYDLSNDRLDYPTLLQKIETSIINDQETTQAVNLLTALIHRDGLDTLENFTAETLGNPTLIDALEANGVHYNIDADGNISGTYKDTAEGTNGNDVIYATDSGTVYGGEGDDTIYGTDGVYDHVHSATGTEVLYGGAGNDKLVGGAGSDILDGGEGDDYLVASSSAWDSSYGHDVLIGGKGDDTLVGNKRNSTYVYNYGDGDDTIIDSGNIGTTGDILELRGISVNDIVVEKADGNLILKIKDTFKNGGSYFGSITITDGLSRGKIEKYIFDDKTVDFKDILQVNDTYVFSKGMGEFSIYDRGSLVGDVLQLEGLTPNEVIVRAVQGSDDLIVAIKEAGVAFEDLSDKVVIKNWFNPNNRIETFTFGDGTTWNSDDILLAQSVDNEDNYIRVAGERDSLHAQEGNDTIKTDNNSYAIDGGAGDDSITTGAGNDTLQGNSGNDTLQGGGGNDTYVFNIGDGEDVVFDGAGSDTFVFGDGILPTDVVTKAIAGSDDLIVAIKEAGVAFQDLTNKVTIKNWFNPSNQIETFTFSDGTSLDVNGILSLQEGTSGDDYLRYLDGNDVIQGDAGNDTLQGGSGNDTYLFNLGDGEDVVFDGAGSDTFVFGDGILPTDVVTKAIQGSDDLIVKIKDDSITIKNWFNPNNRIETFTFSDGTIWNSDDILLAQSIDSEDNYIRVEGERDSLNAQEGNDTIQTDNNSYAIDGGAGNDDITTGAGNDTLQGNTGNDTLQGGGGNDTYVFNLGDGVDTIYDNNRYKPYPWVSYTLQGDAGDDTLNFGAGITQDNLIMKLDAKSNDLVILVNSGTSELEITDRILIKDWKNGKNRIENIAFSDGSTMDEVAILEFAAKFTEGVDQTIYAMNNTKLEGHEGDDTYVVSKGLGTVTVYDEYKVDNIIADGGNDTLYFQQDISMDDILIQKSGNNLIVAIKEEGKSFEELKDKFILVNWYREEYRIENFNFGGDTTLDVNGILSLMAKTGDAYGTSGADTISGSQNDDTIFALGGNDTLTGGAGEDNLQGGSGNDTYVFKRGDGEDTVYDDSRYRPYSWSSYSVQNDAGEDTLQFGNDITSEDIVVKVDANSNDLIVALKENGKTFSELKDKMILKDWFNSKNRIETFTFSDGTSLDVDEIINFQGTNEDDTTHLIDNTANLTIDMKAGNDVAVTGSGDDTLSGGTGEDNLQGGSGNDTYVFKRGDGRDVVFDSAGDDTLHFSDISSEDVIVRLDPNSANLVVAVKEAGVAFDDLSDKVTIKNWLNANNRVETITFSDGTSLDLSNITDLQGSSAGDTISLLNKTSFTIDAGTGNDDITTGAGNDTLQGNSGNDTLQGGGGNDTYVFNLGDGEDVVFDGAGSDTFVFGDGILPTDVVTKAIPGSDDLIVKIKDDSITLKNWFNPNNRIETFTFSDGTSLDVNGILSLQEGTSGDDYLRYLDANDVIQGDAGNDTLQGGSGNDTYVFNLGDGVDTIYDLSGFDSIYFTGALTADDIELYVDAASDDIILGIKEAGVAFEDLSDKIILKDGQKRENSIEIIRFESGEQLYLRELGGTFTGTEGDDVIPETGEGGDISVTVHALGGDDRITFGDGDNIINAGAGNDTVVLGDGANIVDMGEGSATDPHEYLTIGNGNNIVDARETVVSLSAGNGNNSIKLANDSSVKLGDGDNRVYAQKNNSIELGSGDNYLEVGNNNNIIFGDGNNTIVADADAFIQGGDGNNNLELHESSTISLGDGDNTLLSSGNSSAHIVVGDGNNGIHTTNTDSYINVGSGDDTIEVASENVEISSLGGNDNITVHSNNNLHVNVNLESGNSTVNIANETIEDSTGNISAFVHTGNSNSAIKIAEETTIDANSVKLEVNNLNDGADGNNTISIASNATTIKSAGSWDDGITLGAAVGDGENIISLGSNGSVLSTTGLSTVELGTQKGNNTIWVYDDSKVSAKNIEINAKVKGSGTTSLATGAELSADSSIRIAYTDSDRYDFYGEEGVFYRGRIPYNDIGSGNNNIKIATQGSYMNANYINMTVGLASNNNTLEVGDNSFVLDTDYFYNQFTIVGSNNQTHINIQGDEQLAQNSRINIGLGGDNNFTEVDTNMDVSVMYQTTDYYRSFERVVSNYGNGDQTLITGSGNDVINLVTYGSHSVTTNEGDDKISLGYGNDFVNAGAGDDTIATGAGDDTIIFNYGDGKDEILDTAGYDVLKFGEGITIDDLNVSIKFESELQTSSGSNNAQGNEISFQSEENAKLVISLKNDPNSVITIDNWYTDGRIENFEFADGSSISDHEIVSLIGTNEEDVIYGTEGENILSSTAGDDELFAAEGDDVYNYNRLSGHDTFYDSEGFDTISFGKNITKDDLILKKVDNNLSISLKEDGKTFQDLVDTINVRDWFNEANRIERFTFADGSSMELDEILAMIDADGLIFYGTPEIDEMHGDDDANIILARQSDDIVDGGAGNDILAGEEGNDTLIGGLGNDLLYGGLGDDVYIVDKNQGYDRIVDSSGNDSLKFADGIGSLDIALSYENDDLIVSLEGTTVRLQGWYTLKNQIENFEFADGEVLGVNDILNLMATNDNDDIKATELDSQIESGEGDDLLISNSGNDTFSGGNGDDTYVFKDDGSSDVVIDGAGDDKLVFAKGITADMIKMQWVQGSKDILITFENQQATQILLKDWYKAENRIESFEFADGTLWNVDDIINFMGSDNSDVYNGVEEKSNTIYARDGHDIVSTFTYDDVVDGGAGSDILDTREGNDIVIGGAGDDILLGGEGDDIYFFDKGFGKDIIADTATDVKVDAGVDTISFGEGIGVDDIVFHVDEKDNNLYVGLKEDGKTFAQLDNVITLENWYNKKSSIEQFRFSSGESISIYDLLKIRSAQNGSMLKAFEEGGLLVGTPLVDYLVGNIGDDEIYGDDSDDTLLGNDGDDILNGQGGNDLLDGGAGNDGYIFEYGSGEDTIYDHAENIQEQYGYVTGDDGIQRWEKIERAYSVNAGNDTVYFGEGITTDKLQVTNDGYNLIISLKDSPSDILTIKDFYKADNKIENFEFTDGTVLNATEFEMLLFTEGDDSVTFVDESDRVVIALEGDDIVTTGSGNDVLYGDSGDDILNGGLGNDTYLFGYGDGHDIVDDNGNAQWWQNGSGQDSIQFTQGIGLDNLVVSGDGDDLVIGLREENKAFGELLDTLTIKNALNGDAIEYLKFSDGSELSFEDFIAYIATPTIENTTFTLDEDHLLSDRFIVNNPLNQTLTYEILTNAANGAFSVNEDGSYSYNPNQDYNGQDSVVIKVTNEYGLSTTSTLTFEIEAVNDAPTVEEIAPINLAEDAAIVSGQVHAHDVDKGAILRYTAPEIAGFTLNSDGSYSFDASDEAYQHLEEGAVETITIPITVLDEYDASAQTDIVIQLTGTNDAPIIEDITPIATREDDALVTGTIISSDVDDNATATFSTDATVAGFILNSDGTYGFNPADDTYQSLAKDEVLDITIPISVTDDKGASDTKELYIRVVGTNDAPTVTVESRDLLLQNIRNIEGKVEANDVDGDMLSYSVATQAAHGTVTIDEQGNWHYKAEGSFNGEDSATILVDDGNGGEVTQTLNFTVDGYIYEGEDLVIDEASGNDTLSMTDINKDELSFLRSSDDLQIAVADGGVVTLKNYFTNTQAGVETLHTAQGDINLSRDVINNVKSRWWHGSFRAKDSQDHLISGTDYNDWLRGNEGNDIILGNNRYDWLRGNEGDDLLIGGDSSDRLYGDEGNDNLYGDSGNDFLHGGEGNDALIGGVGRDILIADSGEDFLSGGSGRDKLFGGSGDDTYRFKKGDGADTVYDADNSSWCRWNQKDGGYDTIEFAKGITKDDIVFSMNRCGDLLLEYGEGDTINIQNQFNENNQIERIELSDGMYITNEDIELVIQQINNYGAEKGMWHIDNNDIKNNQELMNIVSSAWHG